MGTTQPIRNEENIKQLKDYFLKRGEMRNYALFIVGLNLPLRISDILSLKWGQVYNFEKKYFKKYLEIHEKKTGKQNILAINNSTRDVLQILLEDQDEVNESNYIFTTYKYQKHPISRVTAYIIIHNAAESIGLENIGCHSLRKTFGYHAWKKGVHLALIMSIYNHSSIAVTKRYLGIEQEDKDNVFYTLNL